jgi:hypothetical protein
LDRRHCFLPTAAVRSHRVLKIYSPAQQSPAEEAEKSH